MVAFGAVVVVLGVVFDTAVVGVVLGAVVVGEFVTGADLVGSDTHNSSPFEPSSATKYNALPTTVRLFVVLEHGPVWPFLEHEAPGFVLFTITVPALVPSDFHSSEPFVPSSATK